MHMLKGKTFFKVPKELPVRLYWACLTGPLFLGISLGIQFALTLVMAIGPLASWPPSEELTEMGRIYAHPSYDIKAYIIGCAMTVILTLLSIRVWNRHLKQTDVSEVGRKAVFSCIFQITASLVSLLAFFAVTEIVRRLVFRHWELHTGEIGLLLVPGILLTLLVLLYYLHEKTVYTITSFIDQRGSCLIDIAVPIVICLLVYVSEISHLAGSIFLKEGFFHWDHFLMAPAVSFSSGKAFGTDFYSQYGVGWPLLFSLIQPILQLSYENVLHTCVIYGCLYFIGLYVLLRTASRNVMFATAGVLFALFLSVFAPVWSHNNLCAVWQWPSSSILRSAMDVWFFLCILCHLRTKRWWWMPAAGITVGIGILLETDTGLCLAITFVLYWICIKWLESHESEKRLHLPTCIGSWLSVFFICLAGLAVAGRFTIFTQPREFWTGWIEGVTNSGKLGIGGLYLLSRIGIWDIVFFTAIVIVFFIAFSVALIRFLHGVPSTMSTFLGCVGVFGLSRSMVFIWRSLTGNLTHTAIPLSIIASISAAEGYRRLNAHLKDSNEKTPGNYALYLTNRHVPYLALVVLILLIWFSPTFHEYPSMLKSLAKGPSPKGICLIEAREEICGLPKDKQNEARDATAVIKKLKQMREENKKVAILDDRNTLFYLESGLTPWGRNPTIFLNTFTKEQLKQLTAQLISDKLDYVLIRPQSPTPYYEDTWNALHSSLPQAYEQGETVGPFEIWMFRN